MGLWIYLSGVIATVILCLVFIYKDWSNNVDTKLSDILMYITISLASWVTIIFLIVYKISFFLGEHSEDVVIKGKNR